MRRHLAVGLTALFAGIVALCSLGGGVAHAHTASSSFFGLGTLSAPQGLSVAEGEVFTADTFNRRIRVFGADGVLRRSFDTAPSTLQEEPYAAVVSGSGRVYVAEPRYSIGAGRVEMFDPSGTPLGQLGSGLRSPRSLAIDGADRVYVAEWDGTVRRLLADGSQDPSFSFQSPTGTSQYLYPGSVAVGPDRLLVASVAGVTVHRLDGSLERSLGSIGSQIVWDGPDHFISFEGLKLRRYTLDGKLVGSYALEPRGGAGMDRAYAGGVLKDALWVAREWEIERLNLTMPRAHLTASSSSPETSQAVTLDASGSKPPPLGDIVSYRWDLDGDGTPDRDTGSDPTTTIRRLDSGPHRVTVWAHSNRGDGVDLASMTLSVRESAAAFTANPDIPITGEPVQLDASSSEVQNSTMIDVAWDLDGDGHFETTSGSSPRVEWTPAKRGSAVIGLRITRSGGRVDRTTRTLDVRAASPSGEIGISINDGAIATNDRDVTLTVVWPLRAQELLISNDGGFGSAGATSLFPVDAHVPWRLTTLANRRLPRIVYARFRGGDAGRETYTDDIILDERRPEVDKVDKVDHASGKPKARGAAGSTVRLRVTASDDNAGIRRVEVARTPRGRPIAVRPLGKANAAANAASAANCWFAARPVSFTSGPWMSRRTHPHGVG